ncbi:MAG: hypothetical protein SNJ68_09445 [Cyanobacteriota bacterium]
MAASQAEPLTLKAFYRNLENAQACEAPVVKRVLLVGSGEVTIRIRLDPYRAAGKADNFPVRFGEIRNGVFQGWALVPPFERGLGVKTTQGNRDLQGANPTDGLPVERVYRYWMEARSYEFDVSLGPPCLLQGSSGFRQWAQGSEVEISASSAAANTPGMPPVRVPSLAGRWAGYRGGVKVADCSIRQDGNALTFIIHRNPEERSSGQFTSATEVWAVDWGPNEKGRVSADGRRIDWTNSYWVRID